MLIMLVSVLALLGAKAPVKFCLSLLSRHDSLHNSPTEHGKGFQVSFIPPHAFEKRVRTFSAN
jgi:hypothetical protein